MAAKLKTVKGKGGRKMRFINGKLVSEQRYKNALARRRKSNTKSKKVRRPAAARKSSKKPAAPKRRKSMARSRNRRRKSQGQSPRAAVEKAYKDLAMGVIGGATLEIVAEQFVPDDILGIDGSIVVGGALVFLAKGKRKNLMRGFGLGFMARPVSQMAAGMVEQSGIVDRLNLGNSPEPRSGASEAYNRLGRPTEREEL